MLEDLPAPSTIHFSNWWYSWSQIFIWHCWHIWYSQLGVQSRQRSAVMTPLLSSKQAQCPKDSTQSLDFSQYAGLREMINLIKYGPNKSLHIYIIKDREIWTGWDRGESLLLLRIWNVDFFWICCWDWNCSFMWHKWLFSKLMKSYFFFLLNILLISYQMLLLA